MKALTTVGLTKLIQLIKSSFIKTTDTVTTNTVTLATVATSGSYNDLSNKPTIPTVNNATLTIQKNGTTVNTFTANASSNVTANITVPTDTGDLTNNAGFITGINSTDVTNALGYTPYNSTNPNGYLSSSDFKTINNTNIVGSGNIDTNQIFVAEYGTTSYADVLAAYNNGKTLILDDYSNDTYANCIYADSSSIVFARCGYENSVLVLTQYIVDTNGWDSNTYNLADTDLSNLSATGKTVIDGQWVGNSTTVVEGLQLNTSTNISYTLPVPNDGYKYEVILTCTVESTATSGQQTAIYLSSTEMPYAQCVTRAIPRSAASVTAGGSIIIPIGTDRKLTVVRTTTFYGTGYIYLRGYRRIGSNT